ncbi:carbohydrate ABC transporter permease [Oceaniglobus trochenteri]|uniref:carbohydrate ABC transporter permease n=1 Tax=Oceaniglobus trochenteri TaxID=2763260 RepID=UPI001CFFFA9D|nr:carbohydrate ABC transporter permease [Oceaniglobus trochenteri]
MTEHSRLRWLRLAVIVMIAALFFLPLWWMAVSAMRPGDAIFRYLSPLSPWSFLPREWTAEHMLGIWQGSFGRAIFNSIFVTLVTVIGGLAVCSTAAFALAVIDFPFRKSVFFVMVISFLIPFDAIAVPLYGIMRLLDLQNTYTGLILPGIGNGLAVFLLRQFFIGIPKDLREAAFVDGMGWFGIFWRIYLPLSGPAMLSAALILFVFQWQAYLWPLLIAPSPEYKVAAVAIAQFSNEYQANFGLIFAASLVISIIPMVVLTILQRYYSTSVASTGGKE